MTGLLYAAVVGMWVAVIVPTYLKRHDRRELEKAFASPLTEQLAARRAAWVARTRMTPQQRAFVRRRRVLMTLLTWLVFTTLLVATGRLPGYALVVPAAATGGFVRAAIRAAARASVRVPRTRTTAAPTNAGTQWQRTTMVTPVTPPANPRAWRPAAPVLPSYLTAAPAPMRGEPWTSADMLAEAAAVRQERSERIRQAQERFEQARSAAMERARQAAQDAAREHDARRAANE